MVGRDIYEKLIKGYTEKQWGVSADQLPSFIIKRLPVRLTYDNNYFNDMYQGIPIGGYTKIIEKMLIGSEVLLNEDFDKNKHKASKILYTGMIDEYFDYCYGELEYRSLKFETEELNIENFQGNAVVNYTEFDIPYTRIIEHKHFDIHKETNKEKTFITKEYPMNWSKGDEPFYPMNNDKNNELFEKYKLLGEKETNVIFGGRLGMYKYFDMNNVIKEALLYVNKYLK